jgi:ABC-type Mn2+/Zn2+ transport system ATPase subunit
MLSIVILGRPLSHRGVLPPDIRQQLAYLPQHFPFDRRLPMTVEELVGLDARGESEFYHLLYRLKQEQGWTILQISHDLDMVRRHCDRVLCLNRRLLCQGSPAIALSPDNLSAAFNLPSGPSIVATQLTFFVMAMALPALIRRLQ